MDTFGIYSERGVHFSNPGFLGFEVPCSIINFNSQTFVVLDHGLVRKRWYFADLFRPEHYGIFQEQWTSQAGYVLGTPIFC